MNIKELLIVSCVLVIVGVGVRYAAHVLDLTNDHKDVDEANHIQWFDMIIGLFVTGVISYSLCAETYHTYTFRQLLKPK